MAINSGTSTEMATISGENAQSALSYLCTKDPNAQEFSLSDYYSTHGNGAGMANEYPQNFDVNDVSFGEIWEGAKNIGKSVLETVGLMKTKEEKQIVIIQEYFKNPSPQLSAFIGSKYNGNVDGKINSELSGLISKLENALNNMFDTRAFNGVVLSTTPQDINSALQKALEYKKFNKSSNKDDIVYKIGKKIISVHKFLPI